MRAVQTDWFRGATITVRFDDERQLVMFVANNGRAPTLELPAAAFVTATANGPKLELVGAFDRDTKIALKLATPADAQQIARVLSEGLRLPRQPQRVTLDELARLPDGALVIVEGRVFPFANGPVMENRIDLLGVSGRIEHNAPYRVAGFYRRGSREQIRVLAIEQLNPPVTWFTGETVRVIWIPERELLAFAQQPGHTFVEPGGTHELLVPPDTIAWALADGDRLTFEGDLRRTGYKTRVTLGPVSANDARAIFVLLDERFQLPRTPRPITPADVASIAAPTLVCIEGLYRMGHIEGANFEGGVQLQERDGLENNTRYRVTGFLYPSFRPDGPFIGYTGPRLCVQAAERL